jgi:nucleotide-binding universal stress UspA family protein
MISRVGAIVVIAGNKASDAGSTILSNGVEEEVQIALSLGKPVIPVGVSGHVAHAMWRSAVADRQRYLPGLDCATELKTLGDERSSVEQLVGAIVALLARAERLSSTKN